MLTRRAFLPCAAAASAAGLRAASAPRLRVTAIETISLQPEFYHGWPTVVRRKNGGLAMVYSGGRERHVCPFGRVELMRSSDNGKSWSWPEVLMSNAIDVRDAGICETAAGTLLVTTFTSTAYEASFAKRKDYPADWPPERIARWEAVNRRITAAQRKQLLGTFMLRSTDGGLTWSAPYRVPLDSPHGPVAVSGGRLLYAGKQIWEPGAKAGVAESTDDGQTWRWLADIPVRPGDDVVQYHELHAVEAANGSIVVQIRNHNKLNEGETLQCESTDGGRTWTTPHPIGVWGLPSHLLRMRNDELLMTYGYRRDPFGNQVRISRDHGRTWSKQLPLSEENSKRDIGYPATVQLSGSEFLTVWYEKMPSMPKAVLRQARWTLEG
jgi:sialidase-1